LPAGLRQLLARFLELALRVLRASPALTLRDSV